MQPLQDHIKTEMGEPAFVPPTLQSSVPSGEGPRESGETPLGTESEASSVTRLAHFTELGEWKFLAAGIDSLDLGLYVNWGSSWEELCRELTAGKERASGTQGILSADGRGLILPGGKPPNYRWHLQYPEFHLFVGNSQLPNRNTPNAYLSLNSKTLWENTLDGCSSLIHRDIAKLGGSIWQIKPSRLDMASDWGIPNGLTLDFLKTRRVPQHLKNFRVCTGDRLETFYHGAKKSPVQLRIYDKALEVLNEQTKLWFFSKVWKVPQETSVWRVEYQVRRAVLKQFGVNSIDDLKEKLGGLWVYLTDQSFSLREPDDSNTTRRTLTPWWRDVQECHEHFGEALDLARDFSGTAVGTDWYINQIAGYVVSVAARTGVFDHMQATVNLMEEVLAKLEVGDFEERVAVKRIKLGLPGCPATTECVENSLNKDVA